MRHDREQPSEGQGRVRSSSRPPKAMVPGPAVSPTSVRVMRLQESIGNRAVASLVRWHAALQRQAEAGEPDEEEIPAGGGNEQDLSQEEEQEWLAAPTVQRSLDLPVQGAWTGRRQLAPLRFLGRPWVVNKRGNIVNLRLYHEHMFFEDGASPPDLGHMGQQGLGSETSSMLGDYSRVQGNLDDGRMRQAVQQRGDPGPYSLLSNNCQDYVQSVLRIYRQLGAGTGSRRPTMQPEGGRDVVRSSLREIEQ